MKKTVITVLILAAMLLSLAACGGTGTPETTSDDPAENTTAEITTSEITTSEITTSEITTAEVTTAEITTAEVTTAEETQPETGKYELNPAWHLGYPGSSTHGTYKNVLNPNGGMYSYSEIIRFPSAGAVITFSDDNTNSNGDTNYASASAYVISSWKSDGEDHWEIDLSGYNASGSDVKYTDGRQGRTYTYTTTKDNECLRFCFRSGQSTSFTPAAFPTIYVEGGKQPEIMTEKDKEKTETVLDGTEKAVKWTAGYVGSDTNPYGYDYQLNNGAGGYSFSDVIEVAKAGTQLSFIDPGNGSTSSNAFVVSSWQKSGNNWVIDKDGTNLSGSPKEIVSATANGTVYTYITSKDGENIRFCYRSDGSGAVASPKIYVKENAGKGTVQKMIEATADLEKYLKDDLARADYSSFFAGKTIYFIGDSYFAGNGLEKEYVWPALLTKKYNMGYENYGMNGSAISAYASSNNPMVNRYTSMKSGSPDVVVIEGGKNDFNQNVPLGTIDSTDTKTFYGALRTMINGMKAKYPTAVVICLTPWFVNGTNSLGNTVQDYGQAMIKLCADMGVPCINAQDRRAVGVDMTDSTFKSKYCMTPTDVSHLNLDGMKLVLPFFEKQIYDICTKK